MAAWDMSPSEKNLPPLNMPVMVSRPAWRTRGSPRLQQGDQQVVATLVPRCTWLRGADAVIDVVGIFHQDLIGDARGLHLVL
jgi:hypothetical protein